MGREEENSNVKITIIINISNCASCALLIKCTQSDFNRYFVKKEVFVRTLSISDFFHLHCCSFISIVTFISCVLFFSTSQAQLIVCYLNLRFPLFDCAVQREHNKFLSRKSRQQRKNETEKFAFN